VVPHALIARSRFRTQAEARMAVLDFTESRYNPRRRYSALGDQPPNDFERSYVLPSRD